MMGRGNDHLYIQARKRSLWMVGRGMKKQRAYLCCGYCGPWLL